MNAFRISFLVATDLLCIMLLVSLLAGCVTTPQQNQLRKGDFVSNMASIDEANTRIAALALPLNAPKA